MMAVDFYGVKVQYGWQELGVFQNGIPHDGALHYTQIHISLLEETARLVPRDAFISRLKEIRAHAVVPKEWKPTEGLAGQPQTAAEKRGAVENARKFADQVLAALGREKSNIQLTNF